MHYPMAGEGARARRPKASMVAAPAQQPSQAWSRKAWQEELTMHFAAERPRWRPETIVEQHDGLHPELDAVIRHFAARILAAAES